MNKHTENFMAVQSWRNRAYLALFHQDFNAAARHMVSWYLARKEHLNIN